MPHAKRNRKKICHCTEICNRLLGLRQRTNHYQLISDPSTIARSTTPSDDESDDAAPGSDIEILLKVDSDGPGHLDLAAEIAGTRSDGSEIGDKDLADAGQENGDGFYEGSDGEGWDYDRDEEMLEVQLSLEEMEEALEDEMGPDMAIEMYHLRKCWDLSF